MRSDVASSGMRSGFMALVTLFVVMVFPVILFGADTTSEAWDQNKHHRIVIDSFSASLSGAPGSTAMSMLLGDYPSATSPGYHLLLAGLSSVGLGDITLLRLLSSLFGLGLALCLWRVLARFVDQWTAVAMALPLMCSPYFLSGSMWLTTDVAAMLMVTLAMSGLLVARPSALGNVRSGAFAALAVFVRQPTAWLVAVLVAASFPWLPVRWRSRQGESGFAAGGWVGWIVAVVLPLFMLVWLVRMWGGLVPPAYQSLHNSGANPATPAVALSLLGAWGLLWTIGMARRSWTAEMDRWTWVACALGIMCAAIPATNFDRTQGRWGGPIWSLVSAMPALENRSLVLLLLAPLGAMTLLFLLRRAASRGQHHATLVMAVAACAFIAATSANTQCWERYLDLPILLYLPVLVALGMGGIEPTQVVRMRMASLVLAAFQFALSIWSVYRVTFNGGV